MNEVSTISLARFGFNANSKLNGVDPASSQAEAAWNRFHETWEHIAEAIEAEVLRRHGITAPTELIKTRVDILKLNAEMSGR